MYFQQLGEANFGKSMYRPPQQETRYGFDLYTRLQGFSLGTRLDLYSAVPRPHLLEFNFWSKDQLTKKKDRILIKDLISCKWKY